MKSLSTSIIEDCIDAFHEARGSVVKAMPLLYTIWEKDLWSEQYSSLGEFLDVCGVSRSQASRLITVYARFRDVPQLETVDPERLYLAAKLDGTPEEQFAKAANLSRGELREQAIFEGTGSEHACEPIQICKTCGKRM